MERTHHITAIGPRSPASGFAGDLRRAQALLVAAVAHLGVAIAQAERAHPALPFLTAGQAAAVLGTADEAREQAALILKDAERTMAVLRGGGA